MEKRNYGSLPQHQPLQGPLPREGQEIFDAVTAAYELGSRLKLVDGERFLSLSGTEALCFLREGALHKYYNGGTDGGRKTSLDARSVIGNTRLDCK